MEQCWHAVVTEQMGKEDTTPEAMQALDLFLLGLPKSKWEGEGSAPEIAEIARGYTEDGRVLGTNRFPQ